MLSNETNKNIRATRQEGTGQDKIWQDWKGQGKTGQETGQDGIWQDRKGQAQ